MNFLADLYFYATKQEPENVIMTTVQQLFVPQSIPTNQSSSQWAWSVPESVIAAREFSWSRINKLMPSTTSVIAPKICQKWVIYIAICHPYFCTLQICNFCNFHPLIFLFKIGKLPNSIPHFSLVYTYINVEPIPKTCNFIFATCSVVKSEKIVINLLKNTKNYFRMM